jgi:peptidoglycan-associated lipoprotein
MIIKINLLLFFSLLSIALMAQPATMVTYEMKLETADKSAKNHDYYNAIDWFEQAYEESKDEWLKVAVADLYMLARDYNRAIRTYERILRRDRSGEFEEIRFDYARALKSMGRYKDALDELKQVIALTESDSVLTLAQFELEGIRLLQTIPENKEILVEFIEGKVNSGSAESSPAIHEDGSLYFSSFNRRDAIILGDDEDYHAKLFVSEKDKDGEYSKVKALPDLINREGFNVAGVSFSRDFKRMYFTLSDLKGNKATNSKLFVAFERNNKWENPTEIEELNGDFNIKHPHVGELFGREVLFFTSDMPGGKGGYDIYYSEISGNQFGIPNNLGEEINTPGDEITPFYRDGILYFSTDGHPTIGGFDLYSAKWTGSTWEDVNNMGLNYNSPYDDMFMRTNLSGSQGFLVSNRPDKAKRKMKGSDTCCDDIYSVKLREFVIELIVDVNDEQGPLEDARVELYDLTTKAIPTTTAPLEGNMISVQLDSDRRYQAIVKKEGYLADTIDLNTFGIIDDQSYNRKVTLQIDPNYGDDGDTEIVLIDQEIRLNNILYDFDSYDITEQAEQDLSVLADLMEDYPNMIIELSSHTDSRGSASYNQNLSQKRAESAKDWLVRQGIEAERIKPVGYGKNKLLVDCKRCTEEEHQLNRRTEFKILEGPQTIKIKKEVFKERRLDR